MLYQTEDGRHGVEIFQIDANFYAEAQLVTNTGGYASWFTIGKYKSLKNALHYSKQKLKRYGLDLIAEPVMTVPPEIFDIRRYTSSGRLFEEACALPPDTYRNTYDGCDAISYGELSHCNIASQNRIFAEWYRSRVDIPRQCPADILTVWNFKKDGDDIDMAVIKKRIAAYVDKANRTIAHDMQRPNLLFARHGEPDTFGHAWCSDGKDFAVWDYEKDGDKIDKATIAKRIAANADEASERKKRPLEYIVHGYVFAATQNLMIVYEDEIRRECHLN